MSSTETESAWISASHKDFLNLFVACCAHQEFKGDQEETTSLPDSELSEASSLSDSDLSEHASHHPSHRSDSDLSDDESDHELPEPCEQQAPSSTRLVVNAEQNCRPSESRIQALAEPPERIASANCALDAEPEHLNNAKAPALHEKQNAAAICIQKHVRGRICRKRLRSLPGMGTHLIANFYTVTFQLPQSEEEDLGLEES